jgi:hypothetical protein
VQSTVSVLASVVIALDGLCSYLDLSHNPLTGNPPTRMAGLDALTHLSMANTSLSGSLGNETWLPNLL